MSMIGKSPGNLEITPPLGRGGMGEGETLQIKSPGTPAGWPMPYSFRVRRAPPENYEPGRAILSTAILHCSYIQATM
jgi:hypothetical protein